MMIYHDGTVWNGDTSVVEHQEPQVEPVKTLLPADQRIGD
jgi:hypothetical protein